MFHFQLGPEYKAGVAKLIAPLALPAGALSQRLLSGAQRLVVAGVAGWGLVIAAGAVMMTQVSHDKCCSVEPPPAVAISVRPSEPPPVKREAIPAVAEAPTPPPAPAPAPAAKTTQRIDTTPLASILAEPAAKPKHKPAHKKKKDVDNHN